MTGQDLCFGNELPSIQNNQMINLFSNRLLKYNTRRKVVNRGHDEAVLAE